MSDVPRVSEGWYFFIHRVARGLYGLLGGLRGVHTERVPMHGPLIVAPVHVSHLDPPAVAIACRRRMRFMAKEELFKGLLGKLIHSLGAFPVRRGESDTESIRLAFAALDAGEAVLIFPEGTRGDGISMLPLNRGVAMIAKRSGAPVMPVGIVGTHLVLPRGGKPARAKMRVVYGQPFTYAEVATGENERENRALFTHHLAEQIRLLCAEEGLNLLPPKEGAD